MEEKREPKKRNRWHGENPLDSANLVDISDIEDQQNHHQRSHKMSDKFMQPHSAVSVVTGDPVDHELLIWRAANNKIAARKGFSEWQVDNLRRGIRQRNPHFSERSVENGVTECLKIVEPQE